MISAQHLDEFILYIFDIFYCMLCIHLWIYDSLHIFIDLFYFYEIDGLVIWWIGRYDFFSYITEQWASYKSWLLGLCTTYSWVDTGRKIQTRSPTIYSNLSHLIFLSVSERWWSLKYNSLYGNTRFSSLLQIVFAWDCWRRWLPRSRQSHMHSSIPGCCREISCLNGIGWFFRWTGLSSGPSTLCALNWWIYPWKLEAGKQFLPVAWKEATMDASLTGWAAVMGFPSVQGMWSPQERLLPINNLELQAVHLVLLHWMW